MYCPKCKYTSFDHFDQCPKCGRSWESERRTLNLEWLVPSQWAPPQESVGASGESDFSFSATAEEGSGRDSKSPMNTSDFLDLTDSDDTAEFVYDLSDSSSKQSEPSGSSGKRAGKSADAQPEDDTREASADDGILLDFDKYDADKGRQVSSGLTGFEETSGAQAAKTAGTRQGGGTEWGVEADPDVDLELEVPEAEPAEEPALSSDQQSWTGASGGKTASPQAKEEDDLSDLLEDDQLELDDILIELDSEDERSGGPSSSGTG